MFGEAVPVREDGVGQIVLGKENLDGERKPIKGDGIGAEEHRRSIYVQVKQSRPLALCSRLLMCHRSHRTVPVGQIQMLLHRRYC